MLAGFLDLILDICRIFGIFAEQFTGCFRGKIPIFYKMITPKGDTTSDIQRPLAVTVEAPIIDTEGCFITATRYVNFMVFTSATEMLPSDFSNLFVSWPKSMRPIFVDLCSGRVLSYACKR